MFNCKCSLAYWQIYTLLKLMEGQKGHNTLAGMAVNKVEMYLFTAKYSSACV